MHIHYNIHMATSKGIYNITHIFLQTDTFSHRHVMVLVTAIEHIGRLARMSVLDTEVDGSNPGSSMLFP